MGDEVVISTVVTPHPGKAVRKDAAFRLLAKRLADIGLGCVVVTLPVELALTGQRAPGTGLVPDSSGNPRYPPEDSIQYRIAPPKRQRKKPLLDAESTHQKSPGTPAFGTWRRPSD